MLNPRSLGSADIYRHVGHLVNVTFKFKQIFVTLYPMRLQMKFEFNWLSGFRGEDL